MFLLDSHLASYEFTIRLTVRLGAATTAAHREASYINLTQDMRAGDQSLVRQGLCDSLVKLIYVSAVQAFGLES